MKALAALLLTCACAVIASAGSSDTTAVSGRQNADVLDKFIRSGGPQIVAHHGARNLRVSTMGGRMQAEMDVLTSVDASGQFHYDVVRESGSELIRKQVLIKALETERLSHLADQRGQAALTAANYRFVPGTDDGDVVAITLHPHHPSPMLLNGRAFVGRATGEILRLEGRLSETPSWWTKQVDIICVYARIKGVILPVELTSRADIRVAGDSVFRMTYTYASID